MRFGSGLGLMVTGMLLAGLSCSPDRPAYVDDNPRPPSTGGKGTTSSDGGAGNVGNDGNVGGQVEDGGASAMSTGGKIGIPTPADSLTVFNPEKIYIFGTIAEGSGSYAISTVDDPNLYMLGFYSPDERMLEILDGKLLYKNSGSSGIRTFGPDVVSSLKPVDIDYPDEVLRNDPLMVSPPCLAEDDGPTGLFSSPDGRLIYECPDEVWYEDGKAVYDASDKFGNVIAFGYDGWTLLDESSLAIMNLADGQQHTIDGLDVSIHIIAKRATPTGFHIVLTSKTGADTPELWNVTTDAVAERVGIYPLPPVGRDPNSWGVLSTDDALYEIGSGPETFQDIIVRRTLDGDSSVVYDEDTDPRVKLHGSTIFTGP